MKVIRMVIAFALFILLDFIWFKLSGDFFLELLKPIARVKNESFDLNYMSTTVVYVLLALGVNFLVLSNSKQNLKQTLLKGGMLGLVTYGVYDFTNHAVLQYWPVRMMVVDISWGIFSCMSVSYIVTKLTFKTNS